MEKTKYVKQAEVITALVMPATLQTEAQNTPVAGGTTTTFAVYGKADDEQRVWCATFVDSDEALAWVQASKVFGRAVRGAVIAQQEEQTAAADVTEEKPN